MAEPVRLQRYLASAGVAARRKAEALITEGRVKVNGKVVTTLGTKVDPDNDEVEVDGEAVMALDAFYVLLNKPKACITAVTDDRGRPTVMDYLPNLPVPVKPVGRLDFYTEGVLLLTNDGELAARLLAPASHVPKTYHVKVHAQLSKEDLERLREGIQLDDGTTTMPAEVSVLPGESKHTWLGITIHEGKHRQIHRMIEALGFAVDKLQRVAFANLTFHNLRVGDARELTQMELNALRDAVGLDHSKVARGRWHSDRENTDIPRRARAKARDEAEAEAAENELRRQANVARRAANAGDAWDGEGDPDREGGDLAIHHTGLGMEDRDAAGADDGGDGETIKHTGLGMEDRDAAGRDAGRRGPREGEPRGGGGARGARAPGPRGGGRDQGAARGAAPRGGGFDRGGGRDEGGARGAGPRGAGPRGGGSDRGGGRDEGGARGAGPRGAGARGGFDRGVGRDEGGARGAAPRGAGARGGFDRGGAGGAGGADARGSSRGGPRGPGVREVRDYASRGAARDAGPPRGARDEGGARGGFGRGDVPRGAGPRADGPRGAGPPRGAGARGRDEGGARGGSSRGPGPRGGARPYTPRRDGESGVTERDQEKGRWPRPPGGRAGGPSGADRPARGFGPRGGGARGDGPRGGGARGEGPRGGGARGEGPRGGGARGEGPRSGQGRSSGSQRPAGGRPPSKRGRPR